MRYSPRNYWVLIGLGMAAIVAAHIFPHAVRGDGPWSIPAIGFGALVGLGIILAGLSYVAMDDVQKQNLRSDQHWGGVIGTSLLCAVVLPYVLFADGLNSLVNLLGQSETPKGFFFSGVLTTLLALAAGVALAFLYRRLRWMKQ
ncbi:MAG TPA: hypothetical protein VJ798_13600 [Rhizomicrobium sp.]|nr:hypothetical protein [Rhizomicrobium sp.]